MNDQELETRLRARYRARASETEAAPLTLRRDVAAIPRAASRRGRPFGRGRGLTLLAAAAAVFLVGGALAVGSGVLRLRSSVPPAPSLAPLAVASPVATSPSPNDRARPSASPIATAGPGGEWIRTGSMITPRYDNLAVRLLDGRVLAAGGSAKHGQTLSSAELYDPGTGTWSATGSMVHPLDAIQAMDQATLLIDGRVLAGDELYDPATETWTTTGKPAVPGGTATLLGDGRVLLTGSPSQLYDPDSGTWTASGKMVNRWFNPPAAVRLLDGRVLVTGESVGSDVPTKAAELYDPSTGTWSATGSKIQILGNQPLLLLTDGKVLAFDGGYSPELYDPATGSWTMAPSTGHDPGQKVGGPSPLLTDGKVLNIGFPGDPASWLYAPATGSWTQTAAMLADTGGSYQNAATVLLDGTVLVAGGSVCSAVQGCPNGPDGALAGAQRYIPASASLPTGLAAVPAPTPTPTPAPTPTPFPPMAGPVPQGARPWEVTVENRSSRPATLFLATEPLTDMGQLCGSITPDVVPAHTTEKVTFQLPPKSVNDCWLMVRPGPGASGDHGPTNEWPIPGKLVIEDGGDNANGDDLSVLWQGP